MTVAYINGRLIVRLITDLRPVQKVDLTLHQILWKSAASLEAGDTYDQMQSGNSSVLISAVLDFFYQRSLHLCAALAPF